MFILADLWLLLFFAGAGILAVAAAEIGSLLAVGILALSFAATLKYLFGISLVAIVVANPLMIVPILAGYILVGAAYTGFWRWPDYLRSKADSIQDMFESFCTRNKIARDEDAFNRMVQTNDYKSKFGPTRHKEMLSVWILMWPFALAWELSHRPIVWLWDTVYNGLGRALSSIGIATSKKVVKFDK